MSIAKPILDCDIIKTTITPRLRSYTNAVNITLSKEILNMTNPDNIVRVRARNGGRASVYEANGWAQAYTSGILDGNGVTQNTSADMNVLVGGSATNPDVLIAENASGYKIALDLVGQQAIAITAPASNSRISAIVAYTDDLSLSTTENTVTGSPASCGLIVVNGTAASSPSEPTDSQIRSAITADGATGSQASYCVIATILVASNTTIITNSQITNKIATITSKNVDFATYTTEEQVVGKWINGKTIYRKCYTGTITITANTRVNVDLEANSPIEDIISVGGYMGYSSGTPKGRNSIPSAEGNTQGVMTNYSMVYLVADSNTLRLSRFSNADRGSQPYAVWVEYTKQ